MEDKIKQYVVNGGDLFLITLIDTIRDGGTGVIVTNRDRKFYIHQKTKQLHYEYPPTDENTIKDINLKYYIVDRIEAYVNNMSVQLEHNKKILQNVKDIILSV